MNGKSTDLMQRLSSLNDHSKHFTLPVEFTHVAHAHSFSASPSDALKHQWHNLRFSMLLEETSSHEPGIDPLKFAFVW